MLYVPTATADEDSAVARFYDRFRGAPRRTRCSPSPYPPADLRELVLSQDAICVSGGNTANMLAIWRVHRIDQLMREAWEQGASLGRERRDDLLVRAGRHRLVRAAARVDGLPRLPARQRVPALRRRRAPPAALPRTRRRRYRDGMQPTTVSRCTTSAPSCTRSSAAVPAQRRIASPATAKSGLLRGCSGEGVPAMTERPQVEKPSGDVPFELGIEDIVTGDGDEATSGSR